MRLSGIKTPKAREKRINALIDSFRITSLEASLVMAYIDHCQSQSDTYCAFAKINKLIDGYGVEYSQSTKDSSVALWIEYVNTGDTYSPTILYDYEKQHYYLTTWGDIVEKQPRRFNEG